MLRIYLSLFPHLKETVPRNEVGQQEERARFVSADLRGGRKLGLLPAQGMPREPVAHLSGFHPESLTVALR